MLFIRYFVIGVVTCCTVVFVGGVYLEPLSGDLTRLGAVAERSWGWSVPQTLPAIKRKGPEDYESIVVVGDSFSEPNVWQQILENETDRYTKTYAWDAIGSFDCLHGHIVQIKKQAPAVTNLILETVEREFVPRFGTNDRPAVDCPTLEIKTTGGRHGSPTSTQHRSIFAWQLPDPIYAAKAAYGEARAYSRATVAGDAVIVPLRTGQFFSNRRSAWLLYYAGDLEKNKWGANDIATAIRNLKSLSEYAESLNVKVTIVVIPDKSTVYAEYALDQMTSIKQYPIWEKLQHAGISSIDLQDHFRTSLFSTVDLYLPNDTHLGFNGYSVLARTVAAKLIANQSVQKN